MQEGPVCGGGRFAAGHNNRQLDLVAGDFERQHYWRKARGGRRLLFRKGNYGGRCLTGLGLGPQWALALDADLTLARETFVARPKYVTRESRVWSRRGAAFYPVGVANSPMIAAVIAWHLSTSASSACSSRTKDEARAMVLLSATAATRSRACLRMCCG